MPYNRISELPTNVKNPLPTGAQRIWMRVFNASLRSCERRNSNADCETVARTAAWSQVKKEYKKGKDDKWVKKD